MGKPRLFRKRYIPDEIVELKDDKVLAMDDKMILTSWSVLKPRPDISRGYSAYFMDKGVKVSKVFDNAGQMVYWYCDIIETVKDSANNTFTFNDLLIDVLIYPDGQVEVVDMDEFAEAMEKGYINMGTVAFAMRAVNELLNSIYSGNFNQYSHYIDDLIKVLK